MDCRFTVECEVLSSKFGSFRFLRGGPEMRDGISVLRSTPLQPEPHPQSLNPQNRIPRARAAFESESTTVCREQCVAMRTGGELEKKSTIYTMQVLALVRVIYNDAPHEGRRGRSERLEPLGDLTGPITLERWYYFKLAKSHHRMYGHRGRRIYDVCTAQSSNSDSDSDAVSHTTLRTLALTRDTRPSWRSRLCDATPAIDPMPQYLKFQCSNSNTWVPWFPVPKHNGAPVLLHVLPRVFEENSRQENSSSDERTTNNK
ncbi:hypothetical protein K439DRAFT_1665612 [Ramaria rubella]|nr:hypothetical protein K439DRAFT_1665612 [Ramaria rubella]